MKTLVDYEFYGDGLRILGKYDGSTLALTKMKMMRKGSNLICVKILDEEL